MQHLEIRVVVNAIVYNAWCLGPYGPPSGLGATEESDLEGVMGRPGIGGPLDETGKEAGPTGAYGISGLGGTAG